MELGRNESWGVVAGHEAIASNQGSLHLLVLYIAKYSDVKSNKV